MNNKHIRNCPLCDSILFYSSKWNMKCAERNRTFCYSCSQKGENNPNFGKPSWNKGLPKEKQPLYGKQRSKEYKMKRSENMTGSKNHRYGKCLSEQHKQKLRIAVINRIQKYGITAKNFNPKACQFIDVLNKEKGWSLQHALNGGEVQICGYCVDGYDKDKNIIFEYDEKIHQQPNKKLKDLIRQKRIVDCINPIMFIRYDEKNNRMSNVLL